MFWEMFASLDSHYKVLAIVATLVTIGSGSLTIVWHLKTWHKRRLKLLKEYLEDRAEDASERRPDLLRKIANSLHKVPSPGEPNVSRAVENAIQLLDLHHVSAAQIELETLQEMIAEKLDFLGRYQGELAKHQANVHLFLAAIADRRDQPSVGLEHIAKARTVLGNDLDVLKSEGLLQLKARKWTDARDAFWNLEDKAKGEDYRHYKAIGARGRGDALVELEDSEKAIEAYGLAIKRIGEAGPQHRDPVFSGLTYLSLARLQEADGGPDSLAAAKENATSAIAEFRSTNGLGVRPEDSVAAEQIRTRTEAALAKTGTAARLLQ